MYENRIHQLNEQIRKLEQKVRIKLEQIKKLRVKQIIAKNKGRTFIIVQYSIEVPNETIDRAYRKEYLNTELETIENNDINAFPDIVIVYESYTVPPNDRETANIIRVISYAEYLSIQKFKDT